jgi:biopolymer transport protein TolQ
MPALTTHGMQGFIPLLAQFGTIIQVIVLVFLVLSSVGCWAIALHKFRLFGKLRRDNERFWQAFDTGSDFAFIAAAARRFAASPFAALFRVVQQYLDSPNNGRRFQMDGDADMFPTVTPERLRMFLQLKHAEEVGNLERGLPFLATTASLTPFVGLFGTVWGIMQSFHAIGQGGGASLAVVGPGISEALIATAVGLAAAIPAVVFYNYCLDRIRQMEGAMDRFSEDLIQLYEAHIPQDAQRLSRRTPSQR